MDEGKRMKADVVVYGGNPGGVCAAISAARAGASVILLETDGHLGGLNTSGLANNEQHHMFPNETFGGLTKLFFDRLGLHYPSSWARFPGWFNSCHFEQELLRLLGDQPGVTVRYHSLLASTTCTAGRIRSITLTDGTIVEGLMFIDASYEGDLLASANVPFDIGREARSDLEPMAGVTWNNDVVPVSPYDNDGLLPGISERPAPAEGEANDQIQVLNFRITLTNDPEIRRPIPAPARYNPREHELLARCLEAGVMVALNKIIGIYPLPNRKFECNNNQSAVVSIAQRAIAAEWQTATHARRREIWENLREYNLGLFHFLNTDPRVPAPIREQMQTLGLAGDEFTDNGNWPYELYVRQGRRMRGVYRMTQADIHTTRRKPDSIGLGSHYIDAHWSDRYALDRNSFRNEGRLWMKGLVYEIPYRSIIPNDEHCSNLLVPVAVSANHVPFCTIRLEPTWMTLGESAGIAATIALHDDVPVQRVNVLQLQERLRAVGQIIDMTPEVEALR